MLVVTRKKGESVRITTEIRVTICEVWGNKVRLGIEAPKEIEVLREELAQTAWGNFAIGGSDDGK